VMLVEDPGGWGEGSDRPLPVFGGSRLVVRIGYRVKPALSTVLHADEVDSRGIIGIVSCLSVGQSGWEE
jgi:hypothetical protein